MTNNEKCYRDFSNKYSYDYQANTDSSNDTVIFSFWEKNNSSNTFIKFEAKSLEKAFIHAMIAVDILPKSELVNLHKGVVARLDYDKYNKLTEIDSFWSLQDKCWKSRKMCIAAEESERRRV